MDIPFEEKKEWQDLHIVRKQTTEDLPLLLCTLVSLWSQTPTFKALYFVSTVLKGTVITSGRTSSFRSPLNHWATSCSFLSA